MKFALVDGPDQPLTAVADPRTDPDGNQAEPDAVAPDEAVSPITSGERTADRGAARTRPISQVIASLQAPRHLLHARIAERERELAETGQMTGELPAGFRADRFTPTPEEDR